jgi:phospholipid/cholesterol/gamma-HCH transport system substrate-binding protein
VRRPAALLAIALTGITVVLIALGGGSPYVVRAAFADASGLRADYAVRIQGVVVGRVAGVAVTPRDTAVATLELDPSVVPIGAGASASITPSNLLGEKYVQLNRGDVRRPQPSGTTIPLERTSVETELDQVLDAFNHDTRQATAIFLAEQGNALLGRGQDLASLLERLPSSLASARQLVAGLGQDNVALGRLVEESDRILAIAAPQRAALGRLVSSASGALGTLASREQALGDTITAAPGAIAQLRRSLIALRDAAGPLGPAAAGLRASAPSLTAMLRATPAFTAAAQPALSAVTRAAPALRQLGAEGTPVVRALGPAAGRLDRFANTLAPVSRLLDRQIALILDVIQGWGRAIGDRDGVGHIYRIETLLPRDVFSTLLDPNAGPAAPAARPHAPARHRIAIRLPHLPARTPASASPRPPQLPSQPPLPPVPVVPPKGTSGAGSAVNSLLHYLLGP